MVKKCLHILPGVLLYLFALAVLSPVAILAVQSVTGEEGFTLSAYGEFFVWQPTLVRSLVNSLLISLTASVGTIVVALLAAYVFAKGSFRGSGVIFYLYIIMMLLPFQVTMLPQYIISKNLSLYDTPAALILPGIFSPFAVFLLTQVMKSVPGEILEAARLDTRSTLVILWKIILPIIRPGILCAWVLSFTEFWNMVAEPLILLETRAKYPLAIMLDGIKAADALAFGGCVVFFVFPLLLFGLFAEEVMEGLGEYRLK